MSVSPLQQAQADNRYGITADTIVQPLHYLYGNTESNVAIRTVGGRIGNQVVWVEDQPEFSLGEEVLLFLKPVDYSVSQTAVGMQPIDYYEVVGLIQGKLAYLEGEALSFDGMQLSLAELEAKIVEMRS